MVQAITSGVTGRDLGVATAPRVADPITFNYIATLVTQSFYICRTPQIVVDICGVTQTAGSGGACTLSVYKCTGVQAPASGVLLHTGTFNLVGTIYTTQLLSLTTNQTYLTMNVGDRLAYVLTGTATSAVGMIQITVEPLV